MYFLSLYLRLILYLFPSRFSSWVHRTSSPSWELVEVGDCLFPSRFSSWVHRTSSPSWELVEVGDCQRERIILTTMWQSTRCAGCKLRTEMAEKASVPPQVSASRRFEPSRPHKHILQTWMLVTEIAINRTPSVRGKEKDSAAASCTFTKEYNLSDSNVASTGLTLAAYLRLRRQYDGHRISKLLGGEQHAMPADLLSISASCKTPCPTGHHQFPRPGTPEMNFDVLGLRSKRW